MLILICHLWIQEYVCLLQGLRFPNAINYSLFVPQKLQIKVNKCKTITITNFSTPDFSTMNFWTMGLKSSWLKSLGLKCHLSRKLKGHSTINIGLFNPRLFNPMVQNSWLKSPGLKISWLKRLGLKGLELKLGVKKFRVEMSFNLCKVPMKLCLGKKSSVRLLRIQMNTRKMSEGVN